MPRSIQEILDHADELAERFEDYEPGADEEGPVEVYLLQRATLARARREGQMVEAVGAARRAGLSWSRIGKLLGSVGAAAVRPRGRVGLNPDSSGDEPQNVVVHHG